MLGNGRWPGGRTKDWLHIAAFPGGVLWLKEHSSRIGGLLAGAVGGEASWKSDHPTAFATQPLHCGLWGKVDGRVGLEGLVRDWHGGLESLA